MAKKSRTLGKFLAVLLALTLCVSLAAPAFAAGEEAATLTDVTGSEATTQAGEAKVLVSLSGVSGSVSIAQVALSFTGKMSCKSVEFVNGKNDPENGYMLAVTPRSTINSTHRLTAGLQAVTTPMSFDGEDALFIVTFTGDPGDTVTVTVDAENSYCMTGGAISGTKTPLRSASLTATASSTSNEGKSAAVKLTMDKVTDFADADTTFLTLTLTDESTGAVITAALDKSYRDGSKTEPTYKVPLAVLEGHSYTVELSGAGFVTYSKTGERFNADLEITNADFVPGDVNGDGKADAADRTAFDALKSGSAYSYSIAADFNRDGVVDKHDADCLSASSGSGSGGSSSGGSSGGSGGGGSAGGGGAAGGGAVPAVETGKYAVTAASTSGGTVSMSATTAKAGDGVTVTLTPASGKKLSTLKVTTVSGKTVALSKVSDTQYKFTMPAEGVTVSAVFADEEVKPTPAQPSQFSDVPENSYFSDAVEWAVGKGVTSGVGGDRFAPYNSCTRAQAVTFLWRAAGSPEPKGDASFTDVNPNGFYYKAVLWAVEQGITAGVGGGKFNPDGECSRGQIVTFLWRFAGQPTPQSAARFNDVSETAFYRDAVTWAQESGVTSGTGNGNFSPNNVCNRAQIVTFLYRAIAEKN